MTEASAPPLLAHLRARALIAVRGPDRRSLLQGLLTQDVENLAPSEVRYAALLTPQGRLMFDLFLHGREDEILLEAHAPARHALVQRLFMYRLRAQVEITAAEGGVYALWNAPAAPPGWAPDPRLAALGFRTAGLAPPDALDATPADEGAYDAHRLALGAPDPPVDCPEDKTYPIEANFDLLNGIDFAKGCFVGQETTSRMKRRGPVKSRMVPITFDGPAPRFGTEVLAGGALRAGEVLSGREGRALALLRLDRAAGAALTVEGRPVRLDPPAWLALATE